MVPAGSPFWSDEECRNLARVRFGETAITDFQIIKVKSLDAYLSEVPVPARVREHGHGVVWEKTHNQLGHLLKV